MKHCSDCPSPQGCDYLVSIGVGAACGAVVPDPVPAPAPAPTELQRVAHDQADLTLEGVADLVLSHWDVFGERALQAALDVLRRKIDKAEADQPPALVAACLRVLAVKRPTYSMRSAMEGLRACRVA